MPRSESSARVACTASASQVDQQAVAAMDTERSAARMPIVTPSADARSMRPELRSVSATQANIFNALVGNRIDLSDPSVEAFGIDCIWHNMNAEPTSFITFRKWFVLDINEMLIKVAGHVEMGLYQIISVNATKHSLVVVCVSNKKLEEFPEGSLAG